MIQYDVRAENVRETVAALKAIDSRLVTEFRKELRETAQQVASEIKSQIQVTPPLSGMGGHTARALNWAGAKTSVSVSFAGSRRRDVTSLLLIKVDAPKGSPGYIVGESAGKRGAAGTTPQGAHLIAMMTDKFGPLKGKGGNRIAWKYFWSKRGELNNAAIRVVEKFSVMVSRELEK